MANSATTTTSAGAERRKGNGQVPDAEIRLNGAAAAAQTEKESDRKEQDFFWTYTEEPHRTRRLAIIKAHPEVGSSLPPRHGSSESPRAQASPDIKQY